MQRRKEFASSMNIDNSELSREIDFTLAERRSLLARGPLFKILHRFRPRGTICVPGEEILAVYFAHRGREYHLRLPLSLRMLFDYFARHSRMPQSASQVAVGIQTEEFYKQHAGNTNSHSTFTKCISRSYVKVLVRRLREAFSVAFEEAGWSRDPKLVLVSRQTVGNEISYHLKARCEWFHFDLAVGS